MAAPRDSSHDVSRRLQTSPWLLSPAWAPCLLDGEQQGDALARLEAAMMLGVPKGPVCQSCSMPLEKPEDFGTSGDGLPVTDFCRHCFANGTFVDPLISESAMIERCAALIATQGAMAPTQARALMIEVIPTLRRWRSQHDPRPA